MGEQVAERDGVTVVVPTFNERDNIPVLLDRLEAALDAAGRPFEMLVVDDNSPDGTAAFANELGATRRIRAICRTEERGLATAVIRGLQDAKYDLCVCIDADLSHPPEKVPELVDTVEGGARFAIGSRYVDGGETVDWGFLRWVNSIGATLMARPLTKVGDPMSGFFCCRRSQVPFETLNPVGYKIALEILIKMGVAEPAEVPITFTDRLHGESKLTLSEQLRYVQHLERLYRWRWPVATQFIEFCIVGGLGMFVDFAVLSVFVELLGVWFGWARIPAFVAALTFNFFLNDRVTFATDGPREIGMLSRYARFALTCSVGGFINWAVSTGAYVSSPWMEQHYLVAAFIGIIAGTAVNFTGSRNFAFK
ncbi:MAG: glycosyltransferase family 2 protein [Proteobacteria bacterium]|nr:glycosyltransferase family 2 protein [Pseudomonadota bacterium]